MYITNNSLNEASFRGKLDPISKNVIKKQNPIKLLVKDLKYFNTQNPVIGNLIREVDIGKKEDLSKFLSQAPDAKDLELQSRLNKLRYRNEFFNGGDDNNNDNYLFISPSSLPQPPIFLRHHLFNCKIRVICLVIIDLHRRLCCHLRNSPPTRQPPNLSLFNNEQTSMFSTPPAPVKKAARRKRQRNACPGTG